MTNGQQPRSELITTSFPTSPDAVGSTITSGMVEFSEPNQETATDSINPQEIQDALFHTDFDPATRAEPLGELVAVLAPYGERAEDGTGRLIFNAGDSSFSFKAPEEYPIYPTQDRVPTKLLTERSKRPTPNGDQFDDYSAQVAARTPETGGSHFTVDHTLGGVLELARNLNPQDESLSHLCDEVKEGKYSERALVLIDVLAAASYVDDAGNLTKSPNPYGDALVILALQGDVTAQSQIALRTARLHEHDAAKAQSDHEARVAHRATLPKYESATGAEVPKASEYMTVHVTGHEPQRAEDGTIMLKTRFDTTGFSRPSLHFTLNHIVESHVYGNFDTAAYAVVTPLDKMIDANGKPKNLLGVDTWWNRNPGQPVACPDAVLVAPNRGDTAVLFEDEGDIIRYKTANFTEADVSQIIDGLAALEPMALIHALPSDVRAVVEQTKGDPFRTGSTTREVVVKSLLGSTQETDDKASQTLRFLAKKLAVDTVLNKREIQILEGDMWASSGEEAIRALAGQLDIDTAAHSATPEYRMEQQYGESYHPADAVTAEIEALDPASRRVLIASGIKATRQPIEQKVAWDDEDIG